MPPLQAQAIADALVEAVVFIAARSYEEDVPIEEYEDEDIQELDAVKALLTSASEAERRVIGQAVLRAISKLPPEHELIPFYRSWMINMFGEDEEEVGE